ncbi:unnamed protein product [Ceratitis capitata]|uniref:(Mediterranean fruit fly) hypothetical protein n=1 Tax=Ceratitis capitata TaxID=7213 RepID=A0A811UGT1_CERCA|nr:unnamed protein product [Ceratitis capitata]
MEKSIDRILLMSKAAAPSGLVLGIATPTIQAKMATLSPITAPQVLSQSSSTITAPSLTETLTVHSTPIRNSPPKPLLQNRRKRSFQEAIGKSAKDQAEANKIQAESSKKFAEAAVIQAEVARSIAESLREITAISSRQVAAIENLIEILNNK